MIHGCFQQWKNFPNRLTVDEVIAESSKPRFLKHSVYGAESAAVYSRVAAANCRMVVMMVVIATCVMQQSRLTLEDVSIARCPWQWRRRWWLNALCQPDKVEPICVPLAVYLHWPNYKRWIVLNPPVKSLISNIMFILYSSCVFIASFRCPA